MEYNTTRNGLEMREYGRHIQKMIEYLLTLEDAEKRQRNAQALIELMGFLNPHLKNVEDFRRWKAHDGYRKGLEEKPEFSSNQASV